MFDGDIIQFDPDILTLPRLTSWLRTQNPYTEYDFYCNGGCLLYQYFVASGIEMPDGFGVGGNVWSPDGEEERDLPDYFADIAVGSPRTFGGALERAIEFATLP